MCISDKSAHGYIAANTLVSSHSSLLPQPGETTNTLEEHSVICNDVQDELFKNDLGWMGGVGVGGQASSSTDCNVHPAI